MALTGERLRGFRLLADTLRGFGLASLISWARERIVRGDSEAEIMISMRETNEFRTRFAGMFDREANGYPPISVESYLDYERTIDETFRRYGMPAAFRAGTLGFISITRKLIANDVSPDEFIQDRMEDGFARADAAPPEVKLAFTNYFGPQGRSALASLYLDPELAAPQLKRMTAAAEVGGAAMRFGFDVSKGRAVQLARLGLEGDAAMGAFSDLDQIRATFDERFGEDEDLRAEEEGIDAVMGTGSQGVVKRRLEERAADLGGGGGAVIDREGILGLGTAR